MTNKLGANLTTHGTNLTFESTLEDFDHVPMTIPQVIHQPSQLMHFEASTLPSCYSFSIPSTSTEDQPWSITTLVKEDSIKHGYWDSDEEDYPTTTIVEAISQEPHEHTALQSDSSVGESDHSCTVQVPSSPKCGDAFNPGDQMVNDCPIDEVLANDDPDFLGVEFFLSKYEEWMLHTFPFDVKQACNSTKEHLPLLVWSNAQMMCPKTLKHLPFTASQMALATLAFHGVLSPHFGDLFPSSFIFLLFCYLVLIVSYLLSALQWQDPP